MKQSQFFIPTLKEIPNSAEAISHQYMLKAGYINQTAAGVYTYLPMANAILENIKMIIREELTKISAAEILMPVIVPKKLWEESGRWSEYGDELMRLSDRHGHEFSLGATHEETIVALMRDYIKSYKDMPINLFQISNKYRDELRPRFGILRGREFIMKDGYSFHNSLDSLNETFEQYREAYTNILNRLNLKFKILKADSGNIGGSESYEFMVLSEIGEDFIIYNNDETMNLEVAPFSENDKNDIMTGVIKGEFEHKGKVYQITKGIEVGHIFKLNQKYSKLMHGKYVNDNNEEKFYEMGCYGIGVSRLLSAIIENHHDKSGIILPKSVAPFTVHIIPASDDFEIQEMTNQVIKEFEKINIKYLVDDRNKRLGFKLADSELIGLPYTIVIGKKGISENKLEFKVRQTLNSEMLELSEILQIIK